MVKSGYKQTDVGVVPLDWTVEAAINLVESNAPICYGVVQVGSYDHDGVPIIAIKHIKEILSSNLHRTSRTIEQSFSRSRVKAGDVLLSIKGTIGRVGVVPGKFEGNISREIARLRVKKEFSPIYLAYQFENDATQKRIMNSVVGTTRLEFSIASLKLFKIPVPANRSEQIRIAKSISDVDRLIGSLEKLIEKKRAIKTATMQQLLTGKKRLPDFGEGVGYKQTDLGPIPEDWQIETVDSFASITTGDKNTQDRVDEGKYPFFVRSNKVERINSYAFEGKGVLTAGDGVGTGKVYHYIDGRFDYHQRVYLISRFREDISAFYFYLWFSNNFYNRIMSMTAKSSVDSVRREMIAGMGIPIPSFEEQESIALILSDMDSEINALVQRLEKTKQIKQGMMQELLTGRIRLV